MKLYRPTETTKFHIDRAWFEKSGLDFRIAVYKCLTPELQERLGDPNAAETHDYVNETTGEVERVDTILRAVRVKNARDPEFITAKTPIYEAAFRAFLLNGNQPLSPVELAEMLHRKPSEILNRLGGREVYNGVRPMY